MLQFQRQLIPYIFCMQISTCPFYTICKYFWNLIKIVHFRTKQRFSDFCKQTSLNEQKDSMCNKAYTHKILQGYMSFLFMFQECNLVHVLSMEFINYSICPIFSFINFLECLRRQDIALL